MKIFVAGATGVLGRSLVPQLVARGHEVVGMTRSAAKQDQVRSLGARPVVADALDPDAVAQAVASAEPEVIVHQLTALSGAMSLSDTRHPERYADGDDDQPPADRGDGPPPGRGPRRRRPALRGAELRRVPVRPHGRAGADRGRAARSRPAGAAAAGGGGTPPPGAGGDVDRVGRGPRVALRRLLRPRDLDQPGSGCADGGADPQAPVPDRRRRRRRLVDTSMSRTPRRRPSSRSSTAGRASTTSSTTSPRPCASGCRCWRARWMPSRRGASRAGWGGWRPARRRRS